MTPIDEFALQAAINKCPKVPPGDVWTIVRTYLRAAQPDPNTCRTKSR